MIDFVLPILPDGSLASSVITTVWVGVLVVCFFNLRFGWVLSGLVVPGYVVPLLITKPLSAMVVLFEASLVYCLFWLFSEKLSGPSRWSSFFGRDRFMGLILVTVSVRLVMDGWLLPIAAEQLSENFGWRIEWANSLHSFGLIVIALLANQFWKPGFVRGMAQSLVMIGTTFIIVRYGLMEFTNFRIGSVAYLYEDFATSILASPKAYVILITTCLVASRLNLLYGWDFSGILIPALLALQWYQPWKILTSIVEALVIFFLASALLSSRLFSGSTIEGGRKILLFFNISFAYRLILGHALSWADFEYRVTDYYGFGYLLPTLIALKAHDKGILPRVLRTTVQTSLVGAVVGSAIGFSLNLLLPRTSNQALATGSNAQRLLVAPARMVAVTVGAAQIDAAEGEAPSIPRRTAEGLQRALAMIDSGRTGAEARLLLKDAGYFLEPLAGGGWAIRPRTESGVAFLFDPSTQLNGCINVREPLLVPGLAMASLGIKDALQARWLAIGGGARLAEAKAGVSLSYSFEEALGPCLNISFRRDGHALMRLAGETGSQLALTSLRSLLPRLEITFSSSAEQGSSLVLTSRAVESVLTEMAPLDTENRTAQSLTREELAFLLFEVVDPLLEGGASAVPIVRNAAAALDLKVTLEETQAGQQVIALRRRGEPDQVFILRPESSGPILQIRADENIQDLAQSLFRKLNARALLVITERNTPNEEGAELAALISQALLRRSSREALILQLRRRPVSYANSDENQMLLATDLIGPGDGLEEALVQALRKAELNVRPLESSVGSAGLEIGSAAQLRFARQALGARVAILWAPAEQKR
ncbi:hypothetical protein G7A66_13015 [Altererythrobacter sp. SALINAS58]|uniref:poly-gamma-glutamate biosynthesis protein PgsC/CapC n=1 Tax=Alteripontixanthobacter muriae TaxID=2705546 RepID=UPI0015767F3B|nr:poly-gamma-glutamate biosynthesis protein PgsC/CapC [Alteripontixanthobacter muriae]NTZ43984.1 hypothetical protein [Alteripontixanthobacter muriae]